MKSPPRPSLPLRTTVLPLAALSGLALAAMAGAGVTAPAVTVPMALLALALAAFPLRRLRLAEQRAASALAALQATEQRLALATASDSLAIFEWKVGADVFILDARGCELYGFSPSQVKRPMPREPLRERHHPEDRERVREELQRAMDSRQLFKCRYRVVLADEVRHLEVTGLFSGHGDDLCMVGITRDVSSQARQREAELQARQALEASEQRFRLLWETAPDAVVMMDQSGTVLYANSSLTTTFGHRPEDVVGRNIEMLQPPRLREAHRRGMARYLAHGTKRMNWRAAEAAGLHRDGHEFPLDVSFSHISHEGAHVFAGFMRDISQRKQAETARLALEEQLRQSQRLESIGTLTGGIAHDFNNVLAAILGNARLSLLDTAADHPAHAGLRHIQQAAKRARNLVNQLLAFSRPQKAALTAQPLRPLVDATVELLRPALPPGVALSVKVDTPEPWAAVDPTQLEQVLMNLCTNAVHAVSAGTGRIDVGLDSTEVAPPAEGDPAPLPAGRYSRITVADNGCGMTPQTLARIFEPFFTTRPTGQGTGLGLSVTHGIVKAHGGAVLVNSLQGQGTTFDVLLPWVDGDPLAVPPEEDSGFDGLQGEGKRVLYVDDDELMVAVMHRLLERDGLRVTTAHSGEQALALLDGEAAVDRFDLVITDLNMPKVTGFDLADRLKGRADAPPVLLTSGYITETLREQAAQCGACGLIGKERLFDDLLPRVRALLG
ncbi:PAS domain S-box protein [Aquabacterium sp. J223]|uniref:hybrid sensor histidine kinase/response regulator n=1 Tax=Aquabacterium sp. J223 TaxID=2898431 RepID=UPI0021AD74A2|nr:PAS domain S-box protein [Aquabacterium sp. J223]UUX95257.1 PAS domain S-box protein [Aquabacterium sp. J223]